MTTTTLYRPLVIIHGWSDHAASFKALSDTVTQHLHLSPTLIDLADYISMDDDIRYSDLVTAMERAWQTNNLPRTPRAVDVIVHSTGGLIFRDWLTSYFKPAATPVYHLLMLAPANFGSPLAHKGEAFIGRIIKGIHGEKLFQVGEQLLKGLELASPYSWKLAQRDRFNSDSYYDSNRILCTVLIGNTGYDGIAAAANEPGSDGTVRNSTANMHTQYAQIDFSKIFISDCQGIQNII